jgi:hypothetical protein
MKAFVNPQTGKAVFVQKRYKKELLPFLGKTIYTPEIECFEYSNGELIKVEQELTELIKI